MPAISGGAKVSHTGEPAVEVRSVTPGDSTDLHITTEAEPEPRWPRALYVGVTGNLAVVALNDPVGSPVTFANVPVGWFPVRVRRVMLTNTTATNIIAVY